MKKLLAFALLATTSVSYAASREIYDVMYLPKAGTVFGASQLNIIRGELSTPPSSHEYLDGYRFTQNVGYSIMDNLSLDVTANYTSIDNTNNGKQKGVSDPVIQGKYRFLDSDYRLDVVGGYIVNTENYIEKTNGDSNNTRGGSGYFAGLQVGNKFANWQWSFLAQYDYNSKATNEDKAAGTKVKEDAFNSYFFRLDGLYKFDEAIFGRAFVSSQLADKHEDNANTTYPSSTTNQLGAEVQRLVTKDVLVRVGLDYSVINANSGYINDLHYWSGRFAASYQF